MTKRSLVTRMSVVGLALLGPGMVAAAGAANRFANVSQKGVLISGGEVAAVTKLGPGQDRSLLHVGRQPLRLRGDDRQRLQPGAPGLHRGWPPRSQWRVRRDQEPGRGPDRWSVQPGGRLREPGHEVRRRRIRLGAGARDGWNETRRPGRRTLLRHIPPAGLGVRVRGHGRRSGQRAGLQPVRRLHRIDQDLCGARSASASTPRTPSTSRPRIPAAACRPASRSTWRSSVRPRRTPTSRW